ncbi:hypothetical protein SE23_17245 [Vibrio sinaloensis]|uniref:ATP-grasp domain-containing protein n=1 Tax=Photobacterium sp. (strain ATCC 43367) TaxID=379097 RepID=UPI00057E5319|nr:ATP-grasp domain-containing protein [Vibrio sinaloensis]KIE19463.1 hypothetical protein SE23_17245 [Vibrio sinaloensis]
MKKILVCSAGAGNAFTYIKLINESFNDQVQLHIADINDSFLVSSSMFCDIYHKIPLSTSDGYKDFMKRLVNENEIDIVIPVINQDFVVFSELYYEEAFDKEVIFSFPLGESSGLASDKDKCNKFLLECYISVPRSYSSYDELPSAFFIKPKNGFGSKDSYIEYKSNIDRLDPLYTYQEILDSEEVTVDCFSDLTQNFIHVTCRERIEVKNGVCTKARLFFDDELRSYALTIARRLNFNGGFCFQVMKSEGVWKVIDLNIRLGAGTSMSRKIGNDYFSATVRLLLGMPYKQCFNDNAFQKSAYVTRQYEDYLCYE